MSILNKSVSWFKNYRDPAPAGETTLLRWLTGSKLKEQVQQIRNAPDKPTADAMKAKLPAITPSGTFTTRQDKALITHSGFICLDIDLKGNEKIRNYHQLKAQLSNIRQVAYCGLSVSGNGYFALIPIAYPEKHLQHFLALEAAFLKMGIRLDEKCKNLSRLRGYSWDPDAFFNHQAEPFTVLLEPATRQPKPVLFQKSSFQPSETYFGSDADRVEALLQKIESGKVDITEDYNNWFAIACNFAATFGEQGRNFFHRVSTYHPQYVPTACDRKYNDALKKTVSAQPDLGAFINRCKVFGLYPVPEVAVSPMPQPACLPLSGTKLECQLLPEAIEPSPEQVERKITGLLKRPEPPKAEIPLYINDLEEKLNNLKRPLPQITASPGETIIDPEKFIQSHLATIKANIGNCTFQPFLDRLNCFLKSINA